MAEELGALLHRVCILGRKVYERRSGIVFDLGVEVRP
jgi:hypothetical protein